MPSNTYNIHLCFMCKPVITMMVANWFYNCIILSTFIIVFYKEELFLLLHLFIYLCQEELIDLYSTVYNLLLSVLILLLKFSKFVLWKSIQTSFCIHLTYTYQFLSVFYSYFFNHNKILLESSYSFLVSALESAISPRSFGCLKEKMVL